MSSSFRSFDLQSQNLAIVTVRKTWEDWVYEGENSGFDREPIAHRGPYTLDVTYTLKRFEPHWEVALAFYADEPPGW